MKKFQRIIPMLLMCVLLCLISACGAPPSAPATDNSSYAPAPTEPSAPAQTAPSLNSGFQDIMEEAEYADGSTYYAPGGERYMEINENQQNLTSQEPLLTFSLKVDTAAYTNVARYIASGNRPPADAVRTEELINYFSYDQKLSFGADPFAIYTEIGPSPFDTNKYLAFIRVKSKDIDKSELPPSNLTFLIDTSGSMYSYDKLPLLQESFLLLTETLGENDRVSIVTYAGNSAVALDSASGADQWEIIHAINSLQASGSTAGGAGIKTAYALAEKNYLPGGNNRIILATDGDFNVGISNLNELEKLISQKRDSGIYLSVLGFGTGNTRDDVMETLAKYGNGNYSYINTQATAQKVLVEEVAANLFTIADDVKAQVEFNPENVSSYRLVGYENRQLANRDFEDDTKDAGEIGVGTDVVMMFELELTNGAQGQNLKYSQSSPQPANPASTYGNELFEVRIRYKNPGETRSNLMISPVTFGSIPRANSSDFNFAANVAAFGNLLRDSSYAQGITIDQLISQAEDNLGADERGYRQEYLQMLEQYRQLRIR